MLLAITSPSCYHLGPQLPRVQLRSMGVHDFPFLAPKWQQILAFPWDRRASGPVGLRGDSTAPSQGAFVKGAGGCVLTAIGTFGIECIRVRWLLTILLERSRGYKPRRAW